MWRGCTHGGEKDLDVNRWRFSLAKAVCCHTHILPCISPGDVLQNKNSTGHESPARSLDIHLFSLVLEMDFSGHWTSLDSTLQVDVFTLFHRSSRDGGTQHQSDLWEIVDCEEDGGLLGQLREEGVKNQAGEGGIMHPDLNGEIEN